MNGIPEMKWPMMPRMVTPETEVYYAWHGALNAYSDTMPIGQSGNKEFPQWMYDAKHAAEEVPRMALLFLHEREGKLCKSFRACACCSDNKHVVDNHLTCCLGKECRTCPHLLALDKAKLPPDQIDWIKAWTCVGHILANGGDRAGEGFITTVDDRMYWDGVYNNLALA